MIGTSRSVWGFDPRSVPGCQLWLDGADPSAMTLSGSNVTQWNDKSGNGRNATGGVSPTLSTNGVTFNGSSQYLATTYSAVPSSETVFVVVTWTGTVDDRNYCIIGTSATNGRGYNVLTQSSGVNLIRWDKWGVAGYGATSGVTAYARFMSSAIYNGTTGTTGLNGGTQSSSAAFTFSGAGITHIGTGVLGDYFLGTIHEIILYNYAVTTSERQQIEGYLAHKWGLVAPSPTTPLSIPGCQLWLDAADATSITGTTTVTQWRDKSGNARHLGVGSGNTSYSSNAIQVNNSYLYVESPVDLSKLTVFIVVKTTGGGNQTVFSGKPNPANNDEDWDSLDGFGFFMDNQNSIRFYGQYANVSTFSVNTSTPQVFSFQSSGTSLTAWYNGVSQTGATLSSARTSTAQGFMVGASWSGSSYNNIVANASVYEAITYNSVLTTTQRQTIEGYLARKWGITSMYPSIPSTHPFSSIRPNLRTFQPIDVPGCQLWLDGADQSSMTLSGSSVTQWNDKSGNGRNVIQTTTTPTDRRPTYINGLLNFNGANFLSGTNTFSVVDSGTLFAVARHSSTRGRVIDIRNNTMSLGIEFGTTPDLFFHNSFGRWGQSFTDGTNDLQIIVNTRNGSSAPQYARNGGSLISFTSSQSTPADNGSYFAVGYDPTGAQYLNGVLCEIIYYSNFLTTSQRQQVEGYLAHKWGLTLSLPVISPLSIPGCQLWLDGADPVGNGVQPSNGATVSTWVDKSGNGYNATTASSRIAGTYSTSLRAVNFVTSNTGYVTSYTAAPTNETMFVVTNNSSLTINNFIIIGGQSGARSLSVASTPNGLGSIGNLKNAIAFLARTGAGTYTAGTTVMVTSQFTSSTNSISLNGGTAENGGAPEFTAGTTTYLGVDTTSPNFYYIGYAMEILFYNSVLTTTQRQQIEGYLARKWGISISATLPSPHPFKSFPPASLHFDPSTKYSALFNNSTLSVPANAAVTLGTNNHTIEFWMYQTSRGQYDTAFSYNSTATSFATNKYYMNVGSYIAILVGNGSDNWAVYIGETTISPLPSLNTWHHYAIVRNGNTFTLYINGISRGTATSSVSIGAQSGPFVIGDFSPTTNTPLFGYITNFRVVNGTAVYTSNFTPPTSPLTAIPNTQILLQGLTDRSANAFTVTNNGGVTLSTLSPFPPP